MMIEGKMMKFYGLIEKLKQKLIERNLTKEKILKLGLNSSDIIKLIEKTGKIETYLTKEKIQELGLDSSDIIKLIEKTGKIETYLTKEKIQELGLHSSDISELIGKTGKIEKYLTKEKIQEWELDTMDICAAIQKTGKVEKYLTKENVTKWGLSSTDIYCLIVAIGKEREYLTSGKKLVELGVDPWEICKLIEETGATETYLTKENVKKWGLQSTNYVWYLIKDKINDGNINHWIYDLGLNHTNIRDCEFLYRNLDYILEKENQTERKEIIKKLYKTNKDIVKAKFEILDNKYLQTLGEDKINQISCYQEYVDKILTLNETELKLLRRCLDFYEKNNKTEEWTPLCERILKNIGTYSKLLETIENIDEMHSKDIEDLTIILLQDNYLDIECIEDVKNFEIIKQKKCMEMFKTGDTEDKINAICISKFGQPKSEIEEFIKKYADGIEYIEDEDLQYYIKSIVEILSIRDIEILNQIFENVEPVKSVNSIAMERNLKNEYGKLYNKELFSIDQAQKCEELGDNIYEVPTDENGNVANFSMIITSIAPFFENNPENFYEDWNRSSIFSQHFCTNYIRRDMLGRARMPHLCYGFSNMKEDSLMLSGSCDISSINEFVPKAEHDEKYLSPDQQINETKKYNELDFRRIQDGKRKQPDYIVVFRKNGKIFNINKAKNASKQFGKATGKNLPIVIVDINKCWKTERRLTDDMKEDKRNGNKKQTVTINELEQCLVETKPEEREAIVRKFKSFYSALINEKRKEVLKNENKKEKSENNEKVSR